VAPQAVWVSSSFHSLPQMSGMGVQSHDHSLKSAGQCFRQPSLRFVTRLGPIRRWAIPPSSNAHPESLSMSIQSPFGWPHPAPSQCGVGWRLQGMLTIPPGPHPLSRRPQRCGRGSQTGAHAASTRAHASARPEANNKAKARRYNSGQGPPTPLQWRRVKHQDKNGSYQ